MQKYTVVQRITRFFWIPRSARRQQPTPCWRVIGLGLSVLAFGAGVTAVGWDDEFGGSYIMAMMLLLNVVDDIIKGVRHRWPAALAAVTLRSGASWLTSTVLPSSLDAAWAKTIAAAVGVTIGFAVAAAITRLPERLAAAR